MIEQQPSKLWVLGSNPNRITTERRARWISGAVFFVLIRRALATVRRRAGKQQAGAAGSGASFCRKIARGAGPGKTERRDVIPSGIKTAKHLIDNRYYSCPVSGLRKYS